MKRNVRIHIHLLYQAIQPCSMINLILKKGLQLKMFKMKSKSSYKKILMKRRNFIPSWSDNIWRWIKKKPQHFNDNLMKILHENNPLIHIIHKPFFPLIEQCFPENPFKMLNHNWIVSLLIYFDLKMFMFSVY